VQASRVFQHEPVGHLGMHYGTLLGLSYARAGEAALRLRCPGEAESYLRRAIALSRPYPDGERVGAMASRGLAAVLLRQGRLPEASQAARAAVTAFHALRRWDDPIHCYVTLPRQAQVATAAWLFREAHELIASAQHLAPLACPGPLHRVRLLEAEAALAYATGDLDLWLSVLTQAAAIAEGAELTDRLGHLRQYLGKGLATLSPKARHDAVALAHRLSSLSPPAPE
ncbi:MAG: tetratricopeptide repeat protein, partial [Chloroflexota bacterium]